MTAIQERKGRDGKPVYRVQIRMKGHPAQSATFSRKTDAKRWAAQNETAIRAGRHFATSEAKRHTRGTATVNRYLAILSHAFTLAVKEWGWVDSNPLLKERAKVRRIDTDLAFPSKVNPSKPIDLRAPWVAALKRAEVEDFRWHELRHSAASYHAMNGASLNEIAGVLGHKTLAMVKRYAHLPESHTVGVVASMNARIFGEG